MVGGGASGLAAAIEAARGGCAVTLLEQKERTGKKILATGNGRCNLTNDCDVREFLRYVRRNSKFLYSSLYAFPPSAAMELFETLGVPLKTERGRRVFPQSDRAADVLAALRQYAAGARGVQAEATGLVMEEGRCTGVEANGRRVGARRGPLATRGGR